jgi:hypothetical protein
MSATPFPDNWSYLKVELNYLERLLLTAVARQKQDLKQTDRVSRSAADRTTSHWWKGLVSLEGTTGYDSPAKSDQTANSSTSSVPQTLGAKILASQTQGIVLALPALCDRLSLTPFEKNLVLVALAPEINRRYTQLYGYLQTKEACEQLPTVDLVLKLFCHNDREWRSARTRLTVTSPLLHHQLIDLHSQQDASLLSRSIKLTDPLVNFLLTERSSLADLADLLGTEAVPHWNAAEPSMTGCRPTPGEPVIPADPRDIAAPPSEAASRELAEPATAPRLEPNQAVLLISGSPLPPSALAPSPFAPDPQALASVILPMKQLATLHHLCDRWQFSAQVDATWGLADSEPASGSLVLLVGAPGTGKRTVAQAIAQTIGHPLQQIDLADLPPSEHAPVRQEILRQNPPVLLLQSAAVWLGRSSPFTPPEIRQFIAHRRHGLTFFSAQRLPVMPQVWRSALLILTLPRPDRADRLKLWQQAFPPQVPLAKDIVWERLQDFALTGGEIQARARSAAIYAAAESADVVAMRHILKAIETGQ